MLRRLTSSARAGDGTTRRGHTFAAVEAIGRALPDVEVTTAWGQPALTVHGKMFVCLASHPSAEPNSLVVMMAFADRDALVEDDPAAYLRLIRLGGHFPKGGYDVHTDGKDPSKPTAAPAVR